MLKDFPTTDNPRVLLGVDVADDAGVYLLRDDLALVQTVDFFTPIVDDPYAFGQIAAANALSDLYSMGATPITALNIIAFPEQGDPGLAVLSQILRGGFDKAAQAGVAILGGHSVDDKEPKYGMAVTGTVHPDKIWTKKGARAGDAIVLTKPLGTGIIATAIKKGNPGQGAVDTLIRIASTLNNTAAQAASRFEVHAATDVTGFGLLNHLLEICTPSGVGARVFFNKLPVLDGVAGLIDAGFVPGGTRKNLAFATPRLTLHPDVTETQVLIAADAQTSGGLLIVLPADQARELSVALAENGAPACAIIGEVIASQPSKILLEP